MVSFVRDCCRRNRSENSREFPVNESTLRSESVTKQWARYFFRGIGKATEDLLGEAPVLLGRGIGFIGKKIGQGIGWLGKPPLIPHYVISAGRGVMTEEILLQQLAYLEDEMREVGLLEIQAAGEPFVVPESFFSHLPFYPEMIRFANCFLPEEVCFQLRREGYSVEAKKGSVFLARQKEWVEQYVMVIANQEIFEGELTRLANQADKLAVMKLKLLSVGDKAVEFSPSLLEKINLIYPRSLYCYHFAFTDEELAHLQIEEIEMVSELEPEQESYPWHAAAVASQRILEELEEKKED